MQVGPNFFIWIAIAVVVVSTAQALYDHYWIAGVGYAIAIALTVVNKLRAIRRKRSEELRNFD